MQCVEELLSVNGTLPVRKVASVVGQIISMSIVLGSVAQLMTRSLSMQTVDIVSWNDSVLLSKLSIQQLQFWFSNISNYTQRSLIEPNTVSRIVYSDASNVGYGWYCVQFGDAQSHGQWSPDEAKASSTYREIKAVYLVMQSIVSKLKSQRVKWFTDNKTVDIIVSKGSMKKHLQDIALKIFHLCIESQIHLEMQWVPRSENERADYLSKIIDNDDWGIADYVFQHLSSIWGPYDVDLFASYNNNKVARFYSRFWNPGSRGVDAFTMSWAEGNNWIVPPVYLVARVLQQLARGHCKAILIVPQWHSANFWPLLCPRGSFISQVKDIVYLPTCKEFRMVGAYH